MNASRPHFLRAFGSLVVASAIFTQAMQGQAAITVFLDYSGFSTRLGELTSSVGISAFTTAEQNTITSGILDSLQTSFAAFDVAFPETPPGGAYPRLWYGDTGGGLGVADHIDYRNKQAADLARVFTAQFTSFIETSEPRAQQIGELTTSLAGTSAHELGHNLGLRHHDSYINVDFPNSIPFNNVDTFMELIDSDGTTVLASDDVSNYSGNTFGSGGSGDGFDPWLFNVPIASSGTYFLRISPESPDSGDYELLIHTDPQSITVGPAFSGDGILDCADIDALVAGIAAGTHAPAFDLTADGFVDLDDRDSWLAQAGAVNLPSGNPYSLGDANLDAVVDFLDFNLWASHRFQNDAAWCHGDFDASGVIDFLDFNIWAANRFQSCVVRSPGEADAVSEPAGATRRDFNAVPEPGTLVVLWAALCGSGSIRHRLS